MTTEQVNGNTSDGYHTFNELYEFRMLYHAALCNELVALPGNPHRIHKSDRHSDGQLCFDGGWFVVVMQLPTGQVTNHYEYTRENWALFRVPVFSRADPWDGHTVQDVLVRLRRFIETMGMPQ